MVGFFCPFEVAFNIVHSCLWRRANNEADQKCQVVAIREGRMEREESMPTMWKDKGAMLKGMEGPVIHPLDRDRFEPEMTECVDEQ